MAKPRLRCQRPGICFAAVLVGLRESRLQLFGALVRDINPVFPLSMVDIEGFPLRPEIFPDRSMMARRPGIVHTGGRFSQDQFSAAEWNSEERETPFDRIPACAAGCRGKGLPVAEPVSTKSICACDSGDPCHEI